MKKTTRNSSFFLPKWDFNRPENAGIMVSKIKMQFTNIKGKRHAHTKETRKYTF